MLHQDFHEIISEIENSKNKNEIIKLTDDALRAISDEKVMRGEYENVLKKVNLIEKIISKSNIERPVFLDYIIASVNFEHLARNDNRKKLEAEKMYKEIINKKNTTSELQNLSKFALCKLYAREIEYIEDIGSEDKKNIENFKKYFMELKELRNLGKLDKYISRSFSMLEDIYDRFSSETAEHEVYIVKGINVNGNHKYSNLKEAVEESKKTCDLLIDLENFVAYKKDKILKLTQPRIIFLYLLAKGTDYTEVKDLTGFSYDVLCRMKMQMKKILEENDIPLQDKKNGSTQIKFRINSTVEIKVIFKSGMDISDYIEKMHELRNKLKPRTSV